LGAGGVSDYEPLDYRNLAHEGMDRWVAEVVALWEQVWKGKDHRYGRDFHAFLGERVLTDFELRHHDRTP